MRRLVDLSISRKLVLAFSLVTALCAVPPSVGAGIMWHMASVERARSIDQSDALGYAQALLEDVARVGQLNYAIVADDGRRLPALIEQHDKIFADIDLHVRAMDTAMDGSDNLSLLRADLDHLRAREKRIFRMLGDDERSDVHDVVESIQSGVAGRLDQSLRQLARDLGDQLRTDQIAAQWRSDATFNVIVAEMLIGMGVIALAALVMSRRLIAEPLDEISRAIEVLAADQLDIDIPGTGRGDEIGLIARALQVFRTRLRERVALQAEAASAKACTERDLRALEDRHAAATHDQEVVVDALAAALRSIAAGDLGTRITIRVAPAYAALAKDFNDALARLEAAMASIAGGATGIAGSASGMSRSALDLSQRTDAQVRSLEESAAALDAITAGIARSAEGAGEARALTGRARQDAERSGAVVDETLGAMQRIETASGEIVHMVRVLDEIAAQTNLLALNATVEAARAGESGRGFTVVANEVRALARRSIEAARAIQSLVDSSARQVRQGVALVTAAGAALREIGEDVLEVDALISAIAGSAQEQSAALRQVNLAVASMDRMTHENAAMVEDTTAAVQALSDQAQAQAEAVAAFRFSAEVRRAA